MKKLTKVVVFAIAVFAIAVSSGCKMMGSTEYSVEPIVLSDGKVICCKATVYNSKDYDKLKFTLKKNQNGDMEVMLDEKGVSATDPASVAAQNQGKMLDVMNELLPLVKGN